jgi:hypothetical protein
LKVFGNFAASVTMIGPSSLPSGYLPAEVRPLGAALALAAPDADGAGFVVSGVHAASSAAPPAAAESFSILRRLIPVFATSELPLPVPISGTGSLDTTSVFDIGSRYLTRGMVARAPKEASG